MCRACFLSFFTAHGGMYGGANPPAYAAARAREAAAAEAAAAEGEGGELLALEGGASASAYEREEREMADEMQHVLEGAELQVRRCAGLRWAVLACSADVLA